MLEGARQEGMEQGMAKGRAEGMAKGRAEGIRNEKIETAMRLLAIGADEAVIMAATGLTKDDLKDCRRTETETQKNQ